MYERSLGEKSPWYAFLQTIEETGPDVYVIPKFWEQSEQEWLNGTEVEYMGGLDAQEVSGVFEDDIKPFIEANDLFKEMPELRTYDAYKSALAAVSSRAFEVDVYRGLCLVPGACLFNHSNSEDVHFESQDAVCPVCGSAEFCEHALERIGEYSDYEDHEGHSHSHEGGCCGHDHSHSHGHTQHDESEEEDNDEEEEEEEEEEEDKEEPTELTEEGISDESENEDEFEDVDDDMEDIEEIPRDEDSEEEEDENSEEELEQDELDTCDVVAIKDIKAGSEIFNTYGELSNGVLLSRYGFALWDNEHETVSVAKELLAYVNTKDLKKRTTWWSEHFYRIIFGIEPEEWSEDMYEDEGPVGDDEEERVPPPSPDSITWLEILDLFPNGVPSPGLMAILYILSITEEEYADFVEKIETGDFDSISFNTRGFALLTSLVEARANRYGDGNLSSKDYKNLLNAVKPNEQRKKLAIIVKGTEKLVIERTQKWIKKGSKN
ncbi:hypothetical protein D0Z03_002267 [Geotrichum reessii]|nr:hypothetical protein D0Z03_002267 [Galactomyces reessii]